jgi:Reverse transcriptase (RNA-dependent DNA polymerase)
MYADDIILLSASISGLQAMLNRCFDVIGDLRLKFNCNKSVCIAFGSRFKDTLPVMYLGSDVVQWSSSLKYLGLTFVSGLRMKCDIDAVTRKFYASSNCIFSNTKCLDELLQLSLQKAYCLPVLQYATSALHFTKTQLNVLNACWNNVYRKIFKYNRWDSVNIVIEALGHLNFIHMWYLSVFKLIHSMRCTSNNLLRQVVCIYCHSDDWLALCSIFNVNEHSAMHIVIRTIGDSFRNSCA